MNCPFQLGTLHSNSTEDMPLQQEVAQESDASKEVVRVLSATRMPAIEVI